MAKTTEPVKHAKTRRTVRKGELSTRESKFVKAKVSGLSNTQAAMIATGTTSIDSAKTQGHRLSTNVNVIEAVQAEMVRQGYSVEKLVQPVMKALTAQKTIILGNGDDAFADVVDDIPTQLRGVQFAAQWMGVIKPTEPTGDIHFHNHVSELRDTYGI